jgi:CRP-like cAMP-binding protein
MDTATVVAALAKTDLLGGISEEDLSLVASIAAEDHLPARSVIFRRGEPSSSVFAVVEGSVRIYLSTGSGAETTLGVVGPHESFGEMALADGGARAASAEALEQVTLLRIARDEWFALLERRPALARALLHSLGTVVRRYADQAVECLFLDLEGRVARVLLRLAESGGRLGEPMRLDLSLTQGELATMVAGSRQSINQILRRLEASGHVRSEREGLLITDREGLARRATP